MDPDYIDHQLNRLPERIGKFGRRFFGLNDDLQIQYTTKSIVFDMNAPSQNDVLFLEASENLEELIDRVLITVEAYNTLEKGVLEFEPSTYIEPSFFDQGVTNIAVINPTGTATMMAPCVRLPESYFHIFFLVKADGYLLAFGRGGDHYFFRRNNTTVQLPFPPKNLSAQNMAVAITWSLEDISISGYVASSEKQGAKPKWEARSTDRKTDATVPPNTLYKWARRQLLLPITNYDNPGQVFNVIMDSLRRLNEEIKITDDIGGFWDEQRIGNRAERREPKREPIITKHIESRLRDITLQKNIDIMREIELGNSKLDLLFSAPLSNHDSAKICVELKKVHADDLVHGLAVQLPEYMRRVGTDYGIYCILYFGSDYPHKIKQFEEYLPAESIQENVRDNVEILLNLVLMRLPYKNLRIVVLDVSRKPSASKL